MLQGFFLFLIFFLLYGASASVPAPVPASTSPNKGGFWDRKAEGWHWYEVFSRDAQREPPPAQEAKIPPTPTQTLATFKAEVTRRLHRALVEPSFQNVKAYQMIQKILVDRSETFAKRWLEVLYQTPELDETVRYPISQAARHIYLDRRVQETTQVMKTLSKRYGLLFFFKGDCPYCHQFAPLVKQFSNTYGWSVLAVSLDGSSLKEFPGSQRDNGAASKLNIEQVPALVAVNPQTGHLVPVSYGMQSVDQLEERFRLLREQGAFP
jgi:conjugal transfer pilus assembly protein TraF